VVRGFTLVEVMVVLVIVGVIMTTVLLTVRAGGEGRVARDEVRRLDHLVELAHDEAVHQMRELGLQFHASGYRFVEWEGSEWRALERMPAFRPRTWPDILVLTLEVEGQPVNVPHQLPDQIRPQVVFLSSGEVSHFVLTLADAAGNGERLRVAITAATEREPLEAMR